MTACSAQPSADADYNAVDTGTLVVVNKGDATATLIDLASGATLATLPTGNGPHEVAVSRSGRWAVVADYGAGSDGQTLTLIDVAKLSVAMTIDLGRYRRPHGIAFVPADTAVLVTSESARAVALVSIPAGNVLGAIPTEQGGSHMLALGAGRLYTSNMQSGTVSEMDVANREFLRTFEVDGQPEAIGATLDGSDVWVGSNARGTVSAIDPASGRVRVVATGFEFPYRIYMSPDPDQARVFIPDLRANSLRVFERKSGKELGVIDLPGGGPESLTSGGTGEALYLSLTRQARVAVIDMNSFEVTGYLPTGDRPDGIGWSPLVVDR